MKKTIQKNNPDLFIKCALIFFLWLFYFPEKAFTQSEYNIWHPAPNNDFETWTGASFEKKLRKKIFFTASPEVKFNNNSAVLKSVFSDFNLYYRYKRYLRFAVCYRLTWNTTILVHRFYGQVYYKNEIIKNVGFTYRGRMERELSERKIPTHALRNKVVVDYNLSKKADPFIASEIIYKIHYKGNFFNTFRFDIGFVLDIGKRKELNLFYRYQKELNEKNPLQSNIIGINYAYSFK